MKTTTSFDADFTDYRRSSQPFNLRASARSASIAFFLLLSLAACQTTANNKMTPAEITAKICPPLEATLSVLQFSPAIADAAKEEIAKGAPLVHSLCAPGAVAEGTGSPVQPIYAESECCARGSGPACDRRQLVDLRNTTHLEDSRCLAARSQVRAGIGCREKADTQANSSCEIESANESCLQVNNRAQSGHGDRVAAVESRRGSGHHCGTGLSKRVEGPTDSGRLRSGHPVQQVRMGGKQAGRVRL